MSGDIAISIKVLFRPIFSLSCCPNFSLLCCEAISSPFKAMSFVRRFTDQRFEFLLDLARFTKGKALAWFRGYSRWHADAHVRCARASQAEYYDPVTRF